MLVLGIHAGLLESCGLLIEDNGHRCYFHVDDSGIDWNDLHFSAVFPLQHLVSRLASDLGIRRLELASKVTRTALAISGIDPRQVTRPWKNTFKGLGFVTEGIEISSLAEAAHVGAFLGRPGILVRCGHGTSTFIVTQRGQTKLLGGWGHGIGDVGSGAWLGRRALRAITNLLDGAASLDQSAFVQQLLSYYPNNEPLDLLDMLEAHRLQGTFYARKFLTEIAIQTLQIAETSNSYAVGLLDKALERLIHPIQSFMAAVEGEGLNIRLSGSLFEHSDFFAQRFFHACCQRLQIQASGGSLFGEHSPIVGIGLIALGLRSEREIQEDGSDFLDQAKVHKWSRPKVYRQEMKFLRS